MKFASRFFLVMLICAVSIFPAAAQTKSSPLDPQPQSRGDDWWTQRHAEKCELMKQGDIDLLMIGDSITHGWENQKPVWDKFYAGRKILNLGFGGDRTENVLWRLQNSPLDAINPKAATIMIGTNNMGAQSCTPREAAEGIRAIVDLLQKQYPDIKVFVYYIFAREKQADGALRMQNDEINSYLPELLGHYKNVTLIDINHKFLDTNGVLEPYIMPDFVHPNTYGYVLWAEAAEPFLKPIFD